MSCFRPFVYFTFLPCADADMIAAEKVNSRELQQGNLNRLDSYPPSNENDGNQFLGSLIPA